MITPKDDTDNFNDYGKEGEIWRERLNKVVAREKEVYEAFGFGEAAVYCAKYLKEHMPDFPAVEKYLETGSITDDALVLIIPIMEDALESYIRSKT